MPDDAESTERRLQVYRDELKALLAARRELGSESEDIILTSFLDRIEGALDARIDARIDRRLAVRASGSPPRRDGRGGRQAAQVGTAAATLAFGIPLSAVVGDEAGLVGLALVWTVIFLINAISILKS